MPIQAAANRLKREIETNSTRSVQPVAAEQPKEAPKEEAKAEDKGAKKGKVKGPPKGTVAKVEEVPPT